MRIKISVPHWLASALERDPNQVASGAHAILLLDQDGWHGATALVVPSNVSLLPLPPRAPELMAVHA